MRAKMEDGRNTPTVVFGAHKWHRQNRNPGKSIHLTIILSAVCQKAVSLVHADCPLERLSCTEGVDFTWQLQHPEGHFFY